MLLGAMNVQPATTMTGSPVAINIPTCRTFILKARTAVDFTVSDEAAMTNYMTVPSGSNLTIGIGSFQAQTIYANAANGTVIELLTC